MKPSEAAQHTTLLAFVTVIFLGGGNFIAVKFSNAELDPLFGAAVRFTIAAAIFFLITSILRIPRPRGRELIGPAIYGLLSFGLALALLYTALTELSAGTTSVIMALVPILTLLFAVAHGQEKLTRRGITGGALALIGIAILSAPTIGGTIEPIFFIAAILGAAAIAESSVIVKSLGHPNPIVTNGIGTTAGAALLWVGSFAFGESWVLPEESRTWFALGYLILFGSVALFILFLKIIEWWSASATVYAIALMPVVAITLGSILADEPITTELVAGAVLVMAAVYLGTTSRHSHNAPPAH